jgi:hypothetical protein
LKVIEGKERQLIIVGFGDYIFDGEYFLHSTFKNSINFYNNDKILTIGNKSIGNGPTNIIFNDISLFKRCKSIIKENKKLFICDLEFTLQEDKIYNSRLKVEKFDYKKFYYNLNLFETYLILISNGKGLSPLLTNNFSDDNSLFYKFILKIKSGSEKIFNGDLIDGINEIKGVGVGLTPSGDDFIYGFITGVNIIEILYNKNLDYLKNLIYESAKGENLISNNFLFLASRGMFFEKTKKLIYSLFFEDEREILERTRDILQIGETSGVDFSVGLILTLKKGGEDVCKRFN